MNIHEEVTERIFDVFSAMCVEGPTSPEYPKLVKSLTELVAIEQRLAPPEPVAPTIELVEAEPTVWDKFATVMTKPEVITTLGNLAGVVLIAKVEKNGFLNPKALSWLPKRKSY